MQFLVQVHYTTKFEQEEVLSKLADPDSGYTDIEDVITDMVSKEIENDSFVRRHMSINLMSTKPVEVPF